MHRGAHGVEKSAIGIRREVHGDLRPRRDTGGDLDVQHDLAVRPIGIAGRMIVRAIHGNRDDVGCRQAE